HPPSTTPPVLLDRGRRRCGLSSCCRRPVLASPYAAAYGWTYGSAHEVGEQTIQLNLRIGGETAMDRARLQHGRLRRLEEAEALGEGSTGCLSPTLVADADPLDEVEPSTDPVEVEAGRERGESVAVHLP